MNTAIPQASLQIVSDELAVTLNEARIALEQYAEGEGTAQTLDRAAALMHTAKGVLRMTETHGGSLLAEEMEQTCRHLAKMRRGDPGTEEPLEALMRAAVQLPAYVERVLNGGRDIPLVLLPLLNDLRAARGRPLLSESTLLLLNVGSATRSAPPEKRAGSGEDLARLCLEFRPRFQLALLGWIRGDRAEGCLRQMYSVAERLEQAANASEIHQLWWVAGGVLEALLENGLETSVSLKRLMGQADREIKRLRTLGEAQYVKAPPTELVNNLLYYVARARTSGPRIAAIRAAFNLSDLMPGDAQVEHARQGLSAPSVKLMQTVAEAIREDLGRVKDVLDIFVRTGMERAEELTPQIELLKKIGDTLGVLGLGDLREIVQIRRQEMQDLVGSGRKPDEQALVGIAAALLNVEDRLEDELISMIAPRSDEPTVVSMDPAEKGGGDLHQVTQAVMRECLINLSRVKDTVAQVIERKAEASSLDAIPDLLRGITAGLLMLGKERAVGVVEELQKALKVLVRPDYDPVQRPRLDRLADATVSLEYYLETLQAGRTEPAFMLDNAERCLDGLLTGLPAETGDTHQSVVGTTPPDIAATLVIPRAQDLLAGIRLPPVQPAPAAVLAARDGQIDPELLELFIEEAREEIESIGRAFAAWEANDADTTALVSLRRSFHTLKGSGRMVGADRIGEYCWTIERMLNRAINGTLPRSAGLIAALNSAIVSLPELLEQLEIGTEPHADIDALIERARAYADGEVAPAAPVDFEFEAPPPVAHSAAPAAEGVTPEAERASDEPAAPPVLQPMMEPVLLDILSREVRGHLAVIERYVAQTLDHSPPFVASEELYRASHTLHGSMAMARAPTGLSLAEAINHMVATARERQARLSTDMIETLRESAAAIAQVLTHLGDPANPAPETGSLELRLRAQAADLELQGPPVPEGEATGEMPALDLQLLDAQSRIVPDEEPIEVEALLPESAAETAVEDLLAEEAAEESPPAVPTPALPAPAAPFDREIAAIFAEEAAELLESADAAIGSLADGGSAEALLTELQRYLHTLKGGARMAGLTVMGDFSHDLETLLIRMVDRLVAQTPAVMELLQASLDELNHLRDAALTGDVRAVSPDLADRLQAALRGELSVAPPPAMPPVPEAEPERESAPETSFEPVALAPPEAAEPPLPVAEIPENEPFLSAEAEEEFAPFAESDEEVASAQEEVPDISQMMPALDRLGELARELELPATRAQSQPLQPASLPPVAAKAPAPERRDTARVDSALLDLLLNNAGEISIFQSRLSQQLNLTQFNLVELGHTVVRLKEQLRKLELETEAQILHRHQDATPGRTDFDPLELDRYSTIQQLSRALAETASDVNSLKDLLQNLVRDAEGLLVQQARTATELQDGLMRTRMVAFHHHGPRLARLVRQIASETDKRAELHVQGSGELDRQVLERMLPPFEHMLRNAVIHGIESQAEREAAGKPATGSITISLRREGAEVVVELADDGRGLDVEAIRRKAVELGFIEPGTHVPDEEAMQFILRPGFSTARNLTQAAGRGIGMDVVASEVAKLGGMLRIASVPGKGTTFTIRLPFTLAVTQALIVRVSGELYALPLPTVEGILRISRAELNARLSSQQPTIDYGGQNYKFRHLGQFLGLGPSRIPEEQQRVSVILVRAGEQSTALVTDEMQDSREIVVKSVGPQLSTIRGIAGATILGDGRIAVILDVSALVRSAKGAMTVRPAIAEPLEMAPLALVVDDSITVRRVTQRLLERNGMRVVTAKDGLEAIGVMQDHKPDIILLDIEMPRMDGYEFAKQVRNNRETEELPIIMITSRVGDKHRARAIEVGVNDYLGKPYQERELLEAVHHLLRTA
jgi:chemosensory pili system protein ChpA (sensor histidine kinase/response regulator)